MTELLDDIGRAKEVWRRWDKILDALEARIAAQPACAWELFAMTEIEARGKAEILSRYGLDIVLENGEVKEELVAPERLPKNVLEHEEYNDAVIGVNLFWYACRVGLFAFKTFGDAEEEEALREAGRCIVRMLRSP